MEGRRVVRGPCAFLTLKYVHREGAGTGPGVEKAAGNSEPQSIVIV